MTKEDALKGLPTGSYGVNLREKKKATATAAHPFAKEGETVEAHPILLNHFRKEGYVK